MLGIASATVRFKPVVKCSYCDHRRYADETYNVDIPRNDITLLNDAIKYAMSKVFIQPPIGWAVNGRNNFTCNKCMEKT